MYTIGFFFPYTSRLSEITRNKSYRNVPRLHLFTHPHNEMLCCVYVMCIVPNDYCRLFGSSYIAHYKLLHAAAYTYYHFRHEKGGLGFNYPESQWCSSFIICNIFVANLYPKMFVLDKNRYEFNRFFIIKMGKFKQKPIN